MDIESYIKGPTRRTPGVVLSPGRILIMGRSIPDNPGDFYTPVIQWVTEYVKYYSGQTRVDLGFDYINTCSTKYIFLIIKQLSEAKNNSINTLVNWYFEHDDDDMIELGLILKSLVECPLAINEVMLVDQSLYEKILSESEQD